ncbi:hypothetical protein ACT453_59730, partial [Bacillus sp. D-CC]
HKLPSLSYQQLTFPSYLERVISGVAAAKERGREGGRKKAHTPQQIQGMMEMLAAGKTKMEVG